MLMVGVFLLLLQSAACTHFTFHVSDEMMLELHC